MYFCCKYGRVIKIDFVQRLISYCLIDAFGQWGCWTASQELRNPSLRIVFPTIERVKRACNGISSSRRILCFAEVLIVMTLISG